MDSLLYENLISHEEYDKLKKFYIINECTKNLIQISENNKSEQEKYELKIQLLHGMMLLMNQILNVFPDMASRINSENSWIKEKLENIYTYEVYPNTEEYVVSMLERMVAESAYYQEYPAEWETVEKTKENILHSKIIAAIWVGDVETIKQCFPNIDNSNKQIQSDLTWSLAKYIMKDKELRQMYYEKYGVKYKIRKNKKS